MGKASYYPDDRNGSITEGGYKYDMNAMTGSHKYFPFGSIISVRNVNNGKTINVKIIDRPYTSKRILDVTYAAAQKLDIIGRGPVTVEVTLVDTPQTLKKKRQEALAQKEKEVIEEQMDTLSVVVDPLDFLKTGTYTSVGEIANVEGYGIQFTMSNDIEVILKEVYKLENDYLLSEVFVQTGWSNSKRIYRLIIGEFDSNIEAQPLLKLLKSGGFDDCFIKKHLKNI
ncbi:SPOR domain-containing protein [Flammeovirga pectinis]|uniref:SPOR domain-containing protein n=1 Tax=Flammeovirga pectinis TaxID=2494373 RepID=A0A3S9P1A4_9BACT|nr:RlpA-like double-psi beta-barrel domain-containing protein [Flammeovirga pectinis]AZQ61983.1 SPOR domain-containing protein [Flammeovirga pectinis]